MKKKAHFIGICGAGMSATAKLLKDLGWNVSGSDDNFYPPISGYLQKYKIPFNKGYRSSNVPDDAEIIIVGKNAKLDPGTNKEVARALNSGISVCSFPEVLRGLMDKTRNVIVAGSSGKSTCTALLVWCLRHAGHDPSFFIGAIPNGDETNAHIGKDNIFVIEGDEYPSASWDSTSKFLYYNPTDVLLTSITHDHVNIFPTHKDYLVPYTTLLSMMPKNGRLVACTQSKDMKKILKHYAPKKTTPYGIGIKNGWHAANIRLGKHSVFDLTHGTKRIITLETSLLGKHNIENIIGVSALLLENKLITPSELKEGIRSFTGIKRRLDLVSQKTSIPIYEGFGSSYEKAEAAYNAIRDHYPHRQIITVFEPHTFSWRNHDSLHWYDTIFKDCAKVYLYEPAQQGKNTHKQLSQAEILKRIKNAGISCTPVTDEKSCLQLLDQELEPEDVILLMTSGNLGGLVQSIPHLLEKKFPA